MGGQLLAGIILQCHCYLLLAGTESVLPALALGLDVNVSNSCVVTPSPASRARSLTKQLP